MILVIFCIAVWCVSRLIKLPSNSFFHLILEESVWPMSNFQVSFPLLCHSIFPNHVLSPAAKTWYQHIVMVPTTFFFSSTDPAISNTLLKPPSQIQIWISTGGVALACLSRCGSWCQQFYGCVHLLWLTFIFWTIQCNNGIWHLVWSIQEGGFSGQLLFV